MISIINKESFKRLMAAYMKKQMQFFVQTLFLLSSSSVYAALIPASHPSFGPNSITNDTNQNLLWLNPKTTEGLSFLDVLNLLNTDTRFRGFRVATTSELANLYSQANIPDINTPGAVALYGTVGNVQGVEYLQSLVGVTYKIEIGGQVLTETAGYVVDNSNPTINGFRLINIGNIALRTNIPSGDGPISLASAYTSWSAVSIGSQYMAVGTWLVSPVSEPGQTFYLCIGLMVLCLFSNSTNKLFEKV